MKDRRLALLACLTVTVFALPAAGVTVPVATGGRVEVLQSSAVSPRARRCLTRLREELTAGGLEVTISEFGAGGDALWMVDPPSPQDGALAPGTGGGHVWPPPLDDDVVVAVFIGYTHLQPPEGRCPDPGLRDDGRLRFIHVANLGGECHQRTILSLGVGHLSRPENGRE